MAYIGIQTPANTSAFGDLAVTSITPIVQLQFPYIINPDITDTVVTGSGTVTHSVPFAVCSTTAATNSTANLQSKNSLHYSTGQGGQVVFTAIYTTGVTGSQQEVGLGDTINGFFFGYVDSVFGIIHRNNSSDTFIPKSTWNYDKMDGTGSSKMTLNPTKGNVYKIQYQWLGFGAINFFIENSTLGTIVLVHKIIYSNLNTVTSLLNPSLPLWIKAINTTNNTNIVVKSGSMGAFIEGLNVDTGLVNAIGNAKTGVTTELNILTIRNNSTFNGIINRKQVVPLFFSTTTTGTKDCTWRIKLNATLGGSPSYTNINATSSVVSYDVAGTTVTGGRLITQFFTQGNTNAQIDFNTIKVNLNKGDTYTISASSDGTAIAPSCAITWSEKF